MKQNAIVALLVRLEAKPGKEADVERLLHRTSRRVLCAAQRSFPFFVISTANRAATPTREHRSIPHSGHSSSFFRVRPESLVFS
jgi:hypothetical protein